MNPSKQHLRPQRISVLLADDHTVVRQGFRALLEGQSDIVIVGEANSGREAVELARKLRPDVVVMDIAMPKLNGLEATRQITKSVPSAGVLILSSYNDDEYVQQLGEAGAAGYLLKDTAAANLLNAIREVKKGNACFSPDISKRLLEYYRETHLRRAPGRGSAAPLSSRETEVLQLIAEGEASKQIADELNLSLKTVENHRQRLMKKLNIHDIASLTRYAIAKGVIKPNVSVRG
jgi:DNA-binding NarL/FixJ family response regulator